MTQMDAAVIPSEAEESMTELYFISSLARRENTAAAVFIAELYFTSPLTRRENLRLIIN